MQEELHRIKSSTMRKKSTDKNHQGSFIQTITDRLSDAKVTNITNSGKSCQNFIQGSVSLSFILFF